MLKTLNKLNQLTRSYQTPSTVGAILTIIDFFLCNLMATLVTRKFGTNPDHIAGVVVTFVRGWFREYIDHLDRIVVFRLSQDLLHEA